MGSQHRRSRLTRGRTMLVPTDVADAVGDLHVAIALDADGDDGSFDLQSRNLQSYRNAIVPLRLLADREAGNGWQRRSRERGSLSLRGSLRLRRSDGIRGERGRGRRRESSLDRGGIARLYLGPGELPPADRNDTDQEAGGNEQQTALHCPLPSFHKEEWERAAGLPSPTSRWWSAVSRAGGRP
jgi:hypothetical protein